MDQNVLNSQQKNDILEELGLSGLPEDKKEALTSQMIDTVLLRVFNRISQVLTDEDINALDELSKKEDNGEALNQMLKSKVPNLDGIIKEEAMSFKTEAKASLDAIKANIPQ